MEVQQARNCGAPTQKASILNWLFFLSCAAFLFTLPFETKFTNFAITAMAISWLFDGDIKMKWYNLKNNRSGHWMFLLYAISLASVAYSENKGVALDRLETSISLVIIGLIIFASTLTAQQISKLLDFFVITTLFTALYCFAWSAYRYLETNDVNSFFYHWFTTPLDITAIYFANFVCTSVIIMLFSQKHSFIPPKARICLVTAMIGLIFLLAALSVTGFLTCLGVVTGWTFLRKKFSAFKSAAVIALGGFALVAILWTFPYTKAKVEKMGNLKYEMTYPDSMWNTVTIRLAKWKGATEVIKNHALFGVGIGDGEDVLMQSYAKLNFTEGLRNIYNEHNQFLANWIAMGIPGVLVLIAMLGVPMWTALRKQDYLLLAFLLLMAASFFTENFLYRQKGIMFFAFFYAILIRRSNLSARPKIG